MYVKAPKEFVEYLAVKYGYDHRYDTSNDRQVFADGSYLLWDRDFLPLCSSEDIAAILPTLGCVALTAPQVRAEQDRVYVNELPEITDKGLLAFLGRDKEGSDGEDPDDTPADEPAENDTDEPTPDNGQTEQTEDDTELSEEGGDA